MVVTAGGVRTSLRETTDDDADEEEEEEEVEEDLRLGRERFSDFDRRGRVRVKFERGGLMGKAWYRWRGASSSSSSSLSQEEEEEEECEYEGKE